MNSEQIAQARVLARLLPVAEQREVVEALLDEIERLRTERDRLRAPLVAAFHNGFVYETLSPGETGIHPGALWTKLWRCREGKWQSKTVCSGLFDDWRTYESQDAFFAALEDKG